MSASGEERGEVLWSPSDDVWTTTTAGRFARAHGHDSYSSLHRWSTEDLAGFWGAVADDLGVMWRTAPTRALADGDATMPGTRWFPGGELNYAEQMLRAAMAEPERVFVVARSDTRADSSMVGADLTAAVARAAAGLRRLGVQRGDRVVAYAPNIPETLVALLATASIGATWASCAPEFGVRAVVDRLVQLDPTVLVAVDGYRYGAKAIDRRDQVAAIRAALPTLRHVVSIPYLGNGLADSTPWDELLDGPDPGLPTFEPVPFDHPLYVLFSSGTTGLPKALVHSHGGITVEHLKVLALHQNLGPADTFAWFSTTGWMMWNYLVSGLLVGSTIALFDGDPGHPDLGRLWRFATDTDCTVFGASAPFLMACRAGDIHPERGRLRWVGSTGAPLPAAGFRWVHDELGVPVSSISGGTDVCTAFVGTSPLVPVRAGEISCALLGCAVEAFGPDGRPLPVGETGELVITRPMPSMPRLLGDDDGSRLADAYYSDFPGVWRHGDWISFTDDGACEITGRSDATLNRGGVRLGTSDVYAVVEELDEVADSLIVHLAGDDAMGELVLFVQLADGAVLDDELRAAIAGRLRRELSPRHVPDRIDAVPAVPRTLSGKKLEVPVKRILEGADPAEVASRDSLADPTALDWFATAQEHGQFARDRRDERARSARSPRS